MVCQARLRGKGGERDLLYHKRRREFSAGDLSSSGFVTRAHISHSDDSTFIREPAKAMF